MRFLLRLLAILSAIARYRLDEFLRDPLGVPLRIRLPLALLLLPFRLRWLFDDRKQLPKHTRLRQALEELGPIFIKFGQLLSTRRDFLDPALADELATLQDDVPPSPDVDIEQLLDERLGVDPNAVFKQFDRSPFASASIAQVYGATLLDGSEVVIKLIRPGIRPVVERDIHLLKWLARLIEKSGNLGKRLRLIEVTADYEHIIYDELNLQNEAANTSQLRRNFANSAKLHVPDVYWDYCNESIMVMDRIDGIPVANIAEIKAAGINIKRLAETGVEIFFTQVFEQNFFHADMHPGNIFVSREYKEQPQYIAIDCAIIGSLSDSDRQYLAQNLLAIFKQNYSKVASLHIESGWVPADTDPAAFEAAIRSVCEPIFQKPLGEISFAQLVIQLFRTAGRFNMPVQPSLVLLQKTLLNIEGLGRQLYPQLDLWQTAMPYLEKWQRDNFGPKALLKRFGEQLPMLIETLPHLPERLNRAAIQAEGLLGLSESLRAELLQQQHLRKQRRSHDRLVGWLCLLVALGLLPLSAVTASPVLPAVSAGLGLLSLYLITQS